jgi:hypothetical protein
VLSLLERFSFVAALLAPSTLVSINPLRSLANVERLPCVTTNSVDSRACDLLKGAHLIRVSRYFPLVAASGFVDAVMTTRVQLRIDGARSTVLDRSC